MYIYHPPQPEKKVLEVKCINKKDGQSLGWGGGGCRIHVLLSTTREFFLKNKVNKNYFVSQIFNTIDR